VTIEIESLGDWRRTSLCGVLRATDVGREVILCGWVHARRDHGGVLFLDLRDRSGLVQAVCNPTESAAAHGRRERSGSSTSSPCAGPSGPPRDTVNRDLPTGEVEVAVGELRVLNTARSTPYPIDDTTEVSEPNRLRWRYLDLRRPHVQRNLVLRHEVTRMVREYLNSGLPRGRDPRAHALHSRRRARLPGSESVQRGSFYALRSRRSCSSSCLMVAGLDRYYQIVRCFRDETSAPTGNRSSRRSTSRCRSSVPPTSWLWSSR